MQCIQTTKIIAMPLAISKASILLARVLAVEIILGKGVIKSIDSLCSDDQRRFTAFDFYEFFDLLNLYVDR